MNKQFINTIVATLSTALTYLIGGWDTALTILAIFIIIDYITGLMKGYVNKEISSETGWKGLMRKAAIFFVVILAHQLDLSLQPQNPIFKTMTAFFYMTNEGLSITENITMLGVPMPDFIVKGLKKIKEQKM